MFSSSFWSLPRHRTASKTMVSKYHSTISGTGPNSSTATWACPSGFSSTASGPGRDMRWRAFEAELVKIHSRFGIDVEFIGSRNIK